MVDSKLQTVNRADALLVPRVRLRVAALKSERVGRETARWIAKLQRDPDAWADYVAEGTVLGY